MMREVGKTVSTLASILLAFATLGAILSSAAVVAADAGPAGSFAAPVQPAALPASYFDAEGCTSSFGIPAGQQGSISAGQAVYENRCAMCHGDGAKLRAMSYHTYKRRLAIPGMSGIELEQQELADVVAWLNRNEVPAHAASLPAPADGANSAASN